MKIGIFDSGLGGLIITHSLIKALPQYDYLYLGDIARVPYGDRSQTTVYQFTEQAVRYLFEQDCQLIIVACNTASAEALRRIQQDYLPAHYPDRRVLGVLIPAAEMAVNLSQNHKIGILATTSTVSSQAFVREIEKLNPEAQIFQQAAPLLVPLIENSGDSWTDSILEEYLAPLLTENIDTLILGCTHYPIIKDKIKQIVGPQVKLICQDEIIADALTSYLARHPEIRTKLSTNSQHTFLATDLTENLQQQANRMFSEPITITPITINSLTEEAT